MHYSLGVLIMDDLKDSILNSVKKLLGIQSEDISFDVDIIININAAIYVLYQIGVLKSVYTVESAENTYYDMFGIKLPEEPEEEEPPILIPPILQPKPEEPTEPEESFELPAIAKEISAVKMYLFYKTRLGFDSPSNGALLETIKAQIAELEWRLNVSVDPAYNFEKGENEDDTT